VCPKIPARQNAGLKKRLKAITDAEHGPAVFHEAPHFILEKSRQIERKSVPAPNASP